MRFAAALLVALSVAGQVLEAQTAQPSVADEIRHRLEQLHETGALAAADRPVGAPGLFEFYELHEFEPAWSPEAGRQLRAFIASIDLDGLDPERYGYTALRALGDSIPAAPEEAAERDLLLTDVLLRVSSDLRQGVVDPASLGPRWEGTPRSAPVPVDSLRALARSGDVHRGLAALRPSHFIYQGLVGALARYRVIDERGGWPTIGPGPLLAVDSVSPRVRALRVRLLRTGDLGAGADSTSPRFDPVLAEAVMGFQHRHGLNEDGVVGRATLSALDVPIALRIDQLRLNLERARWIVHELADDFVTVNIAGQRVYLVEDRAVAWETRAVVGLPYRQTPVFRGTMRYLVVNPTWTVPRSINGEILSSIRRDSTYLRRNGFEVIDASGALVDPAGIHFEAYTGAGFPWVFRQRSGPTNSLGRIKFMFPNAYNVYLHDTPARTLFEREIRASSHGCIRVEDPLRLAELLLKAQGGPDRAGLEALVASGETRSINLVTPIPVLLLYWTASTDLHGEVHFYPDVYQRDPALERALLGPR